MKSYQRLLSVFGAALLLSVSAGCGGNSSGSTSQEVSAVSSPAVSVSEETSAPVSEPAESSEETSAPVSEPAESSEKTSAPVSELVETSTDSSSSAINDMRHPDYLLGKWVLKLDTSDMEPSELEAAKVRMATTSVILKSDGSAVGISGESRIEGQWGESNAYIYLELGGSTEVFGYYVDTLVSINYPGMYFVK